MALNENSLPLPPFFFFKETANRLSEGYAREREYVLMQAGMVLQMCPFGGWGESVSQQPVQNDPCTRSRVYTCLSP